MTGEAAELGIERAAIRRPGGDVTLITYGGSLPKCLSAAEELAAEGVDAEVIDLRALRPLDDDDRPGQRPWPRTAPSSSTRGGAPAASPPR